jgi:uncharacterized protein DUF6152
MTGKFQGFFLAAATVLLASVPMFAHHGTSEYDTSKVVTVPGGTVTKFDFINPHIGIYWEARDDKGDVQKWYAEGTTLNILYRLGWNKDSLKPGDQLKEVAGNQCKNGNTCMRLRKIVLASGQELPIPQ